MDQHNAAKAAVQAYFRGLNERDVSACCEVLAPGYVDHDAPPETPPGPESVREYLQAFLAQYPDMHVAVLDILAEGDRVAARAVWRGADRESGQVLHQMGVLIVRIDDHGKLAERWSAYRALP